MAGNLRDTMRSRAKLGNIREVMNKGLINPYHQQIALCPFITTRILAVNEIVYPQLLCVHNVLLSQCQLFSRA